MSVEQILSYLNSSQNLMVLILALLLLWIYYRFILERALPRAHNVAIIGFDKSGKTTLITTMFDEIFAGRITGIEAAIKSQSTIERVNHNIAELKKGKALGATTDQDLFAYRTDITIGSFLKKRVYKVEIGDFPGNRSQKLSNENEEWLHHTEFFRWVTEADAFVFVIDLARYLDNADVGQIDESSSQDYIIKMTRAIRAAWQNLLIYNQHRLGRIEESPLVLVFTKADLFHITTTPSTIPLVCKKLKNKGLSEHFPPNEDIDPIKLESGMTNATKDFDDLITFLKKANKTTRVLFVSGIGVLNGNKLNINGFLDAVLPFNSRR